MSLQVDLLVTADFRASMLLRNGHVATMADAALHTFNKVGCPRGVDDLSLTRCWQMDGLLACEHAAEAMTEANVSVLDMAVTNAITVLHLSNNTVVKCV